MDRYSVTLLFSDDKESKNVQIDVPEEPKTGQILVVMYDEIELYCRISVIQRDEGDRIERIIGTVLRVSQR